MKQILIIIFLFTLISQSTKAQKEKNWWYFGLNTGLDFTKVTNNESTIPSRISGPIRTSEGCFSISNYKGEFLMASDGMTVYNKERKVMENGTGLKGHPSSSQSGIIIPRPKYPNQYYLVTVPAYGDTREGICYSLVDLNQNGGLGKIVQKNIPINLGAGYSRDKVYENIASVQHANGIDYWLVHRARQYFYSWLVTENGISVNPIMISNIGYDPGVPNYYYNDVSPGNIKFSKDGKIVAHSGWHGMTIGRFDASTGAVTNITYRTDIRPYSCEFSPSGKYLYGNHYRFRTDVGINDQTPTQIGKYNLYTVYGMQIGPDNKIYAFDRLPDKLALMVIENPDEDNTHISYYNNFFTNDNFHAIGWESVYNLPTFAVSTFKFESLEYTYLCENKETKFTMNVVISGAIPFQTVVWDFGDGTTKDITDFSDPIQEVNHTYKKRGTYTLTITPYRDAAKTQPVTNWRISETLKVGSCSIPVNHNISNMKY